MATVGPISQYDILRKLARGGMGEVYLARQTGIEGFAKEVVLKRIHANYAENQQFVKMFLQEARVAALLDHPNIVQIYELGKHGPDYFIVMEYVKGLSLSRLLKSAEGPIPYPFAIQIAAGVAAGLQFAHEKKDPQEQPIGLVHRDISPPNLLLSTSGSVKITDFGIAKIRDSVTETQVGVIKGKYSYISPEQARGEAASRQSDIYSLGLVLYEMTTGVRAYPAGNDKEILRAVSKGQLPPPELHVTNFPEDLRAVLMRALEPDLSLRYTECQELQEDLLSLLVSRRIVTSPAKLGQFVQELADKLEAEEQPVGTGDRRLGSVKIELPLGLTTDTARQVSPLDPTTDSTADLPTDPPTARTPIQDLAARLSSDSLIDLDDRDGTSSSPLAGDAAFSAEAATTRRAPIRGAGPLMEISTEVMLDQILPHVLDPSTVPGKPSTVLRREGRAAPASGPASAPMAAATPEPRQTSPYHAAPAFAAEAPQPVSPAMGPWSSLDSPEPGLADAAAAAAEPVEPPERLHEEQGPANAVPGQGGEMPADAPIGEDDFDDDADTIMVDRFDQHGASPDSSDVDVPPELVLDPAQLMKQQSTAAAGHHPADRSDEQASEPHSDADPEEDGHSFSDNTIDQSSEQRDIDLLGAMTAPSGDLSLADLVTGPAAMDDSVPSAFEDHDAQQGADPRVQEPGPGSLTGATGELQPSRGRGILPWIIVAGLSISIGAGATWLFVYRQSSPEPEPKSAASGGSGADLGRGSKTVKTPKTPPNRAAASGTRLVVAPPATGRDAGGGAVQRRDAAPPADAAPPVDTRMARTTPDAATPVTPPLHHAAARKRLSRRQRQRLARLRRLEGNRRRHAVKREPPAPVPARLVALSLTTTPSTEVFLGGKKLGQTPLIEKVSPGKLTLTFRNKGLGLVVRRDVTTSGTHVSTRFIFKKGILGFQVPNGAKVYLDGDPLGTAPIRPMAVYEGQHIVVVKREGSRRLKTYRPVVKPDKTTWVQAE